ncbi:MAG: B12-binding domain-containing radical SAM protein [Vicinamibacteria bacterium]|nr:B12-binding domain-containing radical SAM protein [Vicinamibacteria bacterium]
MSRRRVLLYNPRGESHILPLALLHIGSMLPEFDVQIVDGRIELAPESTLAELADGAVCLGVTVLTGKPILDALRASRAVKRRYPNLPVIWGGWHPSLLPEQCLASPGVDVCVSAQGEEVFREIVLCLAEGRDLGGVTGISFKRDGVTIKNPPRAFQNVNSFPRVEFGLIDLEKYFAFRGGRRLDYCSSQGCPFECAFCADPMVYKQRWSGLGADRVVAEIAEHKKRFRLDQVFFNDDNFFTDIRRAEAIARGLIDARVDIQWFGTGRADLLRRMSAEQLALMRQSGCYKVNVGAESGSAKVLEDIRKGTLVEEVIESAEKLNRAGIGARFSFIAGFPKEPASSLADTYRTVKTLRKINGAFETPIYFYAPYPGTELSERMPALGFEPPQRLEDWEHVDLDHSIGPWISEPVRKFVPRYNFYLRHAFEPVERGLGKRVARQLARLRVRFDFYRFDFERRLVDLSKRVRTGIRPRQQPMIAEN